MTKTRFVVIAVMVAVIALALTSCTAKTAAPSTPTVVTVASASLIPPLVVTTPMSERTFAATIATETNALSALIARTTTDAQNSDVEAVTVDCAELKASSVQWNADLTQFDVEYPGALAAQGVDPASAQASVAGLLTSCQAFS